MYCTIADYDRLKMTLNDAAI